jgi:DNA-binding XRE family transcriptional regulator
MNRVINEKLGAWLLQAGNTREKLAAEIGITRPTLNGRLDGNSKWTWEEVIEVARITGCSLNELAGMS